MSHIEGRNEPPNVWPEIRVAANRIAVVRPDTLYLSGQASTSNCLYWLREVSTSKDDHPRLLKSVQPVFPLCVPSSTSNFHLAGIDVAGQVRAHHMRPVDDLDHCANGKIVCQ